MYGTYDFIIVGGGTAGSVLAYHLSEIVGWTVLVLEAGNYGNEVTDIPGMYGVNLKSDYNWGYVSVPQKTACLGMYGQQCSLPRGRGVGGCTLINGIIYQRGSPLDWNKIANQGNPGWTYRDILPLFLAHENFTKTTDIAPVNEEYHQTGGPLPLEYYTTPVSPPAEAFYKANEALGFNLTDVNGPSVVGITPAPLYTHAGSRYDTGRAFLEPILNRPNLEVKTNCYVTKVLIDNVKKTATGVQFSYANNGYTAYAKKEVILSAGVVSSPQLLMLSGVGPKKHLKTLEIPVIQNLEVGSELKDHSQFYGLSFTSNYQFHEQSLESQVEQYLNGTGVLTIGASLEVLGFYSIMEKEKNFPDFELIMIPPNSQRSLVRGSFRFNNDSYNAIWGNGRDRSKIFQIAVVCLHCYSSGSVRLKSNNPYDYPLVDYNFLSDRKNHDIDLMYAGIELALKLIDTDAFRKLNATFDADPLPACSKYEFLSKEYWYCAIRQLTYDLFHPVGSCPMGPSPRNGAVVNHELKVHGIKKLRVVDGSIFPETFSGHPSAPTMMVGAKAAEMIKKEYLLMKFKENSCDN